MKRITLLVLVAGWHLLFIPTAKSDSGAWPQFRGPNGSGVAPGDQPGPVEFNRTNHLLWELKLPAGNSSPCIFGDKIFLTAYTKGKEGLETICVDRTKGTVLWRHSVPAEKIEPVHAINNPAASTTVCDGRAVYVYFGSFGLVAYDLAGKELWQKPLPMPQLNKGAGAYGNGTSPIIAGDLVIIDLHLKADSYLLAVRCKDGETAWKTAEPTFNHSFSTPTVWQEDGDTVIGTLHAGRFTAFTAKDGAERWWVNEVPLQAIASPEVGDGTVFLNATGVLGAAENITLPPGFDELLAKYDTNKDGLIGVGELPPSLIYADRQISKGTGSMSVQLYLRFFGGKDKTAKLNREEWEDIRKDMKEFAASESMKTMVCAVRLGGRGDVTKNNLLWTEAKGVPECPSSLYYRQRLYLVKSGGIASCLEPKSGKIIFQERLGTAAGYFASPIAGGGKIYASSDSGKVTVFEAKDTLHVLATNDLGESIMATPALLEGKLYVRTREHLYAFADPAGQK